MLPSDGWGIFQARLCSTLDRGDRGAHRNFFIRGPEGAPEKILGWSPTSIVTMTERGHKLAFICTVKPSVNPLLCQLSVCGLSKPWVVTYYGHHHFCLHSQEWGVWGGYPDGIRQISWMPRLLKRSLRYRLNGKHRRIEEEYDSLLNQLLNVTNHVRSGVFFS